VAEVSRILRFDGIEARLSDPPSPVVVRDDHPTDRHHGWKFIAFGPDGWLYVPVGAPCNVCAVADPHAAITRLSPDGKRREIVARGVRNTVGFDWHPETGDLWFTDNGRDLLGDDLPPDEINRAPKPGLDFGFPRCHGRSVVDPAFGSAGACDGVVPPEVELPAHVAALGLRFYTGRAFPGEYRGDAFVCEHGSWNRSRKIGYRIERVRVAGGRAAGREVFVEGWLQGEEPWGRPVDLVVAADGSLLVSDDHAGVVYRIRWTGSSP
jgi:glucose/arabinose dehydrogenase